MLNWSPNAVRATVGIGGIGMLALILGALERGTQAPFWLLFCVAFMPTILFTFATPDMMPARFVRLLQPIAVLWYFVTAIGTVGFATYRGFASHDALFVVFILVGVWPCALAASELRKDDARPSAEHDHHDHAPAQLLALHPGDTIRFNASRSRAVLLLAGCAIFVAIGIAMIGDQPLLGWLSVGFFGLGIPVAFMMLVPNAMYLMLDAEGFETCAFFRRHKTRWTDVARFDLDAINGSKVIAITFSAHYRKQAAARAVASRMAGMEGALQNNYNAPLPQVLAALQAWHQRFGHAA